MPATLPLFEQSTSKLYYSNDALLHVIEVTGVDDAFRTFNVVYTPDGVLTDDSRVVLSTRERVLADAYIAGYDLATSA